MTLRDLRVFVTATLAIAGVLLVASGFHWLSPLPDIMAREAAPWQPPDLQPPAMQAMPDNPLTFVDALQRPLFRLSRKPFDPAKAALANAPPQPALQPVLAPPPPDTSLLAIKGVMIGKTSRQALLTTPEAPDGLWLKEGSEIMGWTISAVSKNGVTLSVGEQNTELKLYVDNPPN